MMRALLLLRLWPPPHLPPTPAMASSFLPTPSSFLKLSPCHLLSPPPSHPLSSLPFAPSLFKLSHSSHPSPATTPILSHSRTSYGQRDDAESLVRGPSEKMGFQPDSVPSVDARDPGFQRPEAIEWSKDLANRVQLIGRLGRSIEIKYLDTGKVVANTSISVAKPTTANVKEVMWFEVEFWNELAEIAAAHLKKADRVYISGRVQLENYTTKDNVEKLKCKVVAKDLKFVDSNFPDERNTGKSSEQSPSDRKANLERLWQAFFANPSEWWDNRTNKRNPKSPDFKHKSTGEALWIESYANPLWVKSQLAILYSRAQAMGEGKGAVWSDGQSSKGSGYNRSTFQDTDFGVY